MPSDRGSATLTYSEMGLGIRAIYLLQAQATAHKTSCHGVGHWCQMEVQLVNARLVKLVNAQLAQLANVAMLNWSIAKCSNWSMLQQLGHWCQMEVGKCSVTHMSHILILSYSNSYNLIIWRCDCWFAMHQHAACSML